MKTLLAKDWIKDRKLPFRITKNRISTGYETHKHEFFELFYVSEGKFQHNLNGVDRVVTKGDIVLMNPSNKHSFLPADNGNAETVQLYFMPSFLDVSAKLLKKNRGFVELVYMEPFYGEGFKYFHVSGMNEMKIRSLLFEMLYEFEKKPNGFELAVKTKLMDMLITLVRVYEAGKEKSSSVARLSKKAQAISDSLSYIDAHYKEPLKLEDISLNKAGLTKEYYCTVFKKITGRTFTEYVTHLRLEEAKRLLLAGNLLVTDICYDSGFNDLSHFTRTFKSETGVSPLEYRKKNK